MNSKRLRNGDTEMETADIRKKLHQMAETAHHETATAEFIAGFLRNTGASRLIEGIGGNGLIAVFDSGKPGPELLFRAELDALPIPETIDLPYGSKNSNAAHKCGHDGHMAILLGLSGMLREHPITSGKVYLLFQPAEETGEGAVRMLEDKKMPPITPDYAFALHNLPGYPINNVLLRNDVFAAGSAGLMVRLTGNTAHAAHPEQGRSPASAVASIIQDWQSLPQKTIPFDRAGLLTVIHARIGEPAFGTTPGYAEIMTTIRAHDSGDLDLLCDRALDLARTEADRWNLKLDYEWTEVFHPTLNHPEAVRIVEKTAGRLRNKNGKRKVADVIWVPRPFSWSEDFGQFTGRYQGVLFGLGAGEKHPHLHDTHYDFPDELLETGIMLFNGIIDDAGLR